MKKINLFALVASLSLLLTSCSSEESMLPVNESTDLLKTYKVSKDADGNYSLDFDLNDNGTVDKVVDKSTKTSNFYLYSSDNQVSKIHTEDLVIDGEQLDVNFIETEANNNSSFTIIDDNISFAKDEETVYLKKYSIEKSTDNTYFLDFTVNNNTTVDFTYNEEIETYEIHLKEGESDDKKFSKLLEKEEGKALKVDFISYTYTNIESKEYLTSVYKESFESERKPRLIFQ
ncbi:hypothetical protein N9V96_03275 [Polaribacter sp.]|nr:hypothetical protein [Polaribacter sp.]